MIMKIIRGLEILTEGSRNLICSAQRREGSREDLITVSQSPTESYREDEGIFFRRMHRARGNRCKFLQGKLCLGTRIQFFSMRNIKHWNRLTREEVESPWKYSRFGLAETWKKQIQDPSFNRRLDEVIFWGPSQLRLLCDFMRLSKIYKKKAYNAFPCDKKFCLTFFIVIITDSKGHPESIPLIGKTVKILSSSTSLQYFIAT